MRKRSSIILTLLIGVTLGTLVGILFSPSTGTKVRGLIFYQLEKLLRKITTFFTSITHLHSKMTTHNGAKVASQEVINKTIEKAKKLLQEAKTLSEQLDK